MSRKRYTDKFRANAVVMLEAQGYPDRKGALAAVSNHLRVPPSTLAGWFKSYRNPPPTEVRDEKKGDLVDWIQDELIAIFGDMPDARQDASYRDLATAAGILIDKKQLLTGKPTERTEVIDSPRERLRSAISGLASREEQKRDNQLPQ